LQTKRSGKTAPPARPSLPASITGANGPTTTPMKAADVMNQFFIDKVDDL
jgi:hypothetical protein